MYKIWTCLNLLLCLKCYLIITGVDKLGHSTFYIERTHSDWLIEKQVPTEVAYS